MDAHKASKLASTALWAKRKEELAPLCKLGVVIGRGGADRAGGSGGIGEGETGESRENRGKGSSAARLAGGSRWGGGLKTRRRS